MDRHFWLAILISAAIVIPRSLSIAHAHSESYDDQYYLMGGLALLTGEPFQRDYNDPPLGQMIEAVPLWPSGCMLEVAHRDALAQSPQPQPDYTIFYGQPLSPETLLMLVAAWKALLFVPAAGVAFLWCRRLYGLLSAWLALAAVLAEPTLAGHIPVGALDVLGVEGILIASYAAWRYFETPTKWRLIGASAAVAAAIMLKLGGVVMPLVVLGYAILHAWRRRREPAAAPAAATRSSIVAMFLLVALFAWAFTRFDFSRPLDSCHPLPVRYGAVSGILVNALNTNLCRRWPGGIYIAALVESVNRNRWGHPSFLFGRVSWSGWWYYQPAVSLFKVPIGIAIVLLLGAVSFVRRPIRFAELSLIIPAAMCALLLLTMRINIGFRHALSTYVMLILLASRCMTSMPARGKVFAWLAVISAGVQGLMWHPDELSFINLPWRRPYLAISDSNVDWGQGLRQTAAWIDAHHSEIAGRPVFIRYFGYEGNEKHYLGDRATVLGIDATPPTQGILIVSPVYVAGAGLFSADAGYTVFQSREPDGIIGHSLLVFDLDRPRQR